MGKSRNGEGSIRQRKTNLGTVYDVQMTVRNRRTGLSDRIFKGGFKTEKAAVAWRNAKAQASAAGGLVNAKPITVPELVTAWMAATPGRVASTRDHYESVLRTHIKPRLNIRVTSLNERAMRTFFADTPNHATRKGVTGVGSNAAVYTMLSAACKWGSRVSVGLLESNPFEDMEGISRPRIDRRVAMPLPLVRRLLEASSESPSGLIWELLVATGARRGEITGLTWNDLDLEVGTISIDKIATPESSGRKVAYRTKGKEPRKVSLPAPLLARLAALKAAGHGGKEPIIADRTGQRPSFTTIGRWWRRDCELAGIAPGYVPHCLRHTWATTALAAGVPIQVVSSVLGHQDVRTTLTVYAHVTESQRVDAVDLVANALSKLA